MLTIIRTGLVGLTVTLLVCLGIIAFPTASSGSTPIEVAPYRCLSGTVALTFDDGPSPSVTPELVGLLQELDVPATFFMVGNRVEENPDVAREVADAGFTIGNHTWDHADLTDLSDDQVRNEIDKTQRALEDAGVRPSRWVRPPYGAADDRVKAVLRDLELTPAFWTVDSRDWDGLTPREIRRTVVDGVEDRGTEGSVVLHHDGVENSPATLEALPREVARLRHDGYCFVDLDHAPAHTW